MNGAASYLMTVTAAAVLAAILLTLAGQGRMSGLLKLLTGVFMAVTVVSPVLKLELPDMEKWAADFSADGRFAAAQGEQMANEAQLAIIKEELEAYILDKAAACGVTLAAEVTLDNDGIPVGVALAGDVPPDMQKLLTQMIASDLGLEEEKQQWSR